jgi:hypothetical protein
VTPALLVLGLVALLVILILVLRQDPDEIELRCLGIRLRSSGRRGERTSPAVESPPPTSPAHRRRGRPALGRSHSAAQEEKLW